MQLTASQFILTVQCNGRNLQMPNHLRM